MLPLKENSITVQNSFGSVDDEHLFDSDKEKYENPRVYTAEWTRWPLLFVYCNCVLSVSGIGLCFSPAS
jgi:hypothetical protein